MRARMGEGGRRSTEFEAQVLEHLDVMYAVGLRLTRNPTDAQDLTQNTVVKALRFHNRFKDGTYIKAWLLTILRNTFINDYRRKVRRPDFVELTGSETAEGTILNPALVAKSPDLLELLDDEVKNAVESLPRDFRTAVIMADLEGKSYKEIAQAVGCPLGTVMSRLFRGRRMLRQKLYDYAKNRRMVHESK
ncbi:MAG: sigma-70 family RNA polymerase sigma factor [Nitrospiraceae bacterium]|nr:sigma-70 family RNA polymerase sigma factor [Nitrospiraceae bacterium]